MATRRKSGTIAVYVRFIADSNGGTGNDDLRQAAEKLRKRLDTLVGDDWLVRATHANFTPKDEEAPRVILTFRRKHTEKA